MDECAGLTRDSLGRHSKNPWMMCWRCKKSITRKELVGFGQNLQRGRDLHVRWRLLNIHV